MSSSYVLTDAGGMGKRSDTTTKLQGMKWFLFPISIAWGTPVDLPLKKYSMFAIVFKNLQVKMSGWEGSSTTRMTSQLAQGIHRQLNNVMRDGGGQFGQYAPPQGTV